MFAVKILEAQLAKDAQKVKPLSALFFAGLTQQVNLASLDGRARLAELAKPLLTKIPAGPFQQLMLQRLTELSGFEADKSKPTISQHGGHIPPRKQQHMTTSRLARPSLIKKALTLLVRRPELALGVEFPTSLANLELPSVPLLIEMVELIHKHPGISLPAILERWQGTANGGYLTKLAMFDLPLTEEEIEIEFRDTILSLEKMLSQQRLRKALPQDPVAPQGYELQRIGTVGDVISPSIIPSPRL